MNRTKIEERSGKTIQHTLRKHWGSLKQIQGRLLQFFISVFRNARVLSSSTTTLYRTWVFSETSRDLFRRLVLRQKQGSNCLVFFYRCAIVQEGHHRTQQIDRQSALQTAQKEKYRSHSLHSNISPLQPRN